MTNTLYDLASLDLAVITVKVRGSAQELLQKIDHCNPTEISVLIDDETPGMALGIPLTWLTWHMNRNGSAMEQRGRFLDLIGNRNGLPMPLCSIDSCE